MAACGALGVGYGRTRSHHYDATAFAVVQDPLQQSEIVGNDSASANYVADQVAMIILPAVVGSAAAQLSNQTGVTFTMSQFLSKLKVTNAGDNDLVTMTFTDTNAGVAQVGANDELESYETEVRTSLPARIGAAITTIDRAVTDLSTGSPPIVAGSATDQRRRQLLAQRANVVAVRAEVVANGGTDLGIAATSPAALPTAPSGTRTALLGLIGAAVGLLLSGLAAYRPSPRGRKAKRRRRAPGLGMA
jgi:hypothetical protein